MDGQCHNRFQTGGFRWVSIELNEAGELAAHTDKGYLLEVNVS